MERDTWTGIIGATILVAAMVGVFLYERNAAESALEEAGGSRVTLAGPGLDGRTAVGDDADDVVTLERRGLTNVTFTLSWTATAGRDTMRLLVAPSNATGLEEGAQSEPEDDGEITLTVAVPNASATGALGVGDWQVVVSFVSASTGTPVPPGVAPGTSDAAVSWTLTTELQAWAGPDDAP